MGKAIAEAIVNYKENVRADASISFIPDESLSEAGGNNVDDRKTEATQETVAVREVAEKQQEELNPMDKPEIPVEIAEEMKATREINTPETRGSPGPEIPKSGDTTTAGNSGKQEGNSISTQQQGVSKGNTPGKPRIIFKVQIMASAKELALEPKNFNGLNRITKEPYKNLYRYMYGTTESYEQAKLLKSGANASGYTAAYIVAYENGERIPVKDALAKL